MATTTANKLQISAANFFRRVKSFYSHWKDSHKEFSGIDAICIPNGKNEEESIKIKTSAIYVWLFGYELLDSVLFFTKKSIVFLASPKHLALLEHFHAEKGTLDLELQFIPKDDQDNSRNFDKIKTILESDTGLESFKIGRLVKEKQASPFSNEFETFFAKLPHDLVEIGPLIQDTLCVKESEELDLVKKAGRVCVWFEDKVIVEVENIIDSEVKTRHSDISKKIEALLENPNEVKHLENQTKVDKQYADLVYTPIIQSGGDYDLRPQAESTDAYLSYDTIICSVGAKYSEYNCNVVRTLFIDPNAEQRQNYNIAHELQKLILSKLKPGSTLKSVYEAGIEYVKTKKREDLISKLPANLGYGIGLEFREQNLAINNKNEKIIEAGMVFNVTISLSGLKTKNDKDYAIMLADTAIVKQQGPEVLTGRIAREYKEISYSLQGEEVAEEKKTNQPQNNRQPITSKRTRANGQKVEFNEIKRREHQKELRTKKLNELEERFSSGNFYGDKAKSKIETEKLVGYRSSNDLPKDMKKNQIYVDMKNDCVLVPIFGKMVPFHVNVIKNVSKQEDDKKFNALRLNFHVPLATASTITFPEASEQNMMYIRELIFKTRNIKNMTETFKKLKDLQKKAKDQATEEREKKASFNPDDEPLQLVTKGRRPILKDLKVRPNITGKKTSGNLEAHINGFRFIPQKGEKIDVTFKNIKHAFFQPCDSEMIILVHFHLYKPIIIGKRRSYDVQFYTEAGLQAEDLDVRRRGNDDDEIEQEEREKALRKKLNNEFESFTKAVEAASPNEIEFEVPWRELSFQGAPFKSSVSLYPTVHCLVSLTEAPFFIMNLDEVEVAHFERVQYGLKNFDLNFIYKDYSRPVTRICAIPANYLEITKDWLDKMDIIFSESIVNFDWNKILNEVRAQVRDDPKHFLDDGGWDFLQPSGSEDGEGGVHPEDGDDSAFEVSESEDDEESESGYSEDDDDDDEEEGSSSFDGEDDLEEEGLSWDEMEQLAEKEDKQKLADKKMAIKKPPIKDNRQQVKKVKK